MIRRPPSSPLFPSTTLFRSPVDHVVRGIGDVPLLEQVAVAVLGQLVVRAARHDLHLEPRDGVVVRSEEHTSELQSRLHLVCRLLLEKKKKTKLTSSVLQLHL